MVSFRRRNQFGSVPCSSVSRRWASDGFSRPVSLPPSPSPCRNRPKRLPLRTTGLMTLYRRGVGQELGSRRDWLRFCVCGKRGRFHPAVTVALEVWRCPTRPWGCTLITRVQRPWRWVTDILGFAFHAGLALCIVLRTRMTGADWNKVVGRQAMPPWQEDSSQTCSVVMFNDTFSFIYLLVLFDCSSSRCSQQSAWSSYMSSPVSSVGRLGVGASKLPWVENAWRNLTD